MSDRFRHLPDPVRTALSDEVDDVRLERAFRKLRQKRRASERRRPALHWLAAAGLAFAVIVLSFVASPRPSLPSGGEPVARSESRSEPGPLVTSGGGVLARLLPGRVELDDGSSVTVGAGGLVETERNDGREVRLVLVRGRAEIEVRPGGPRAWSIDCGIATVTVVGTRFVLERTATELRVEVTHGTVAARGADVPDGVRFVRAGESLTLGRPVGVETPGPQQPAREAPPPMVAGRAPPPAPPPAADWRELAERGEWPEAYDALGAVGIERRLDTAGPDELLALADVARRSGHPREAVEPLDRLLARHRGPEVALGAFTLGRLHADTLGSPELAAVAFERALDDALPASLVPDALARLATAHAAAGNTAAAVAAARRYLSEYPDGPRRGAMESVAASGAD